MTTKKFNNKNLKEFMDYYKEYLSISHTDKNIVISFINENSDKYIAINMYFKYIYLSVDGRDFKLKYNVDYDNDYLDYIKSIVKERLGV